MSNFGISDPKATVSLRIKHLLESRLFSDVSFMVGGNKGVSPEKISAHKCILGSASPVFELMFNGDFKESKKEDIEIDVPDVSPSGFRDMLRWIYTNETILSLKDVCPLLYCAEKYDLSILKEKCISFMNRSPYEDFCHLFYQSKLHGIINLVPWIKESILALPNLTLLPDSVLKINDNEVLSEILSSNRLNADEVDVLKTALCWASSQTVDMKGDLREILGPALYSIRFPILSSSQFVDEVIPSRLLKNEEILDILNYISKSISSVSCNFSIQPRIRICERFEHNYEEYIDTLKHSITFAANKPIKVHAIAVHCPSKIGSKLTGSIHLEKVNQIGVKRETVSKEFDIKYDPAYETTRIYFNEPITIESKTYYAASIEYEKSSLKQRGWTGIFGRTKVLVDGTHFHFRDYPNSNDECTNTHQGQIPSFCFSRLPFV
ncbi:BTB/POZ domain-containing protein 6-B-like [Lepeophtheirus salmonis]|uniref:BTB/POZ domain-containing protein 6-B-like n=1 Tax=Lepeophtheirus salmonis TaxID=72036 RepID=UPI003AF40897